MFSLIMNTFNNKESYIKNHLYTVCINIIAIIILIIALFRAEGSIKSIVINYCIFFAFANVWSVIDCFNSVQSLGSLKKDDLDEKEHRKLIIASLIIFSIMGLAVFLICKQRVEWSGVAVLVLSGGVYIYYEYTIKKAVHNKKLEKRKNRGR